MAVVGALEEAADPGVVLYDTMGLARGDGTDLDIAVHETTAAVLAVARSLRPDLAAKAMNRGADGFFDIGASADEVRTAILSTQTGWRPGDGGLNPVVGSSGSPAHRRLTGSQAGLTARESEILGLVAQGRSNREIADHIYLGTDTVKTHLRTAYKKIGASNRAEAVAWAIDHGLPPAAL